MDMPPSNNHNTSIAVAEASNVKDDFQLVLGSALDAETAAKKLILVQPLKAVIDEGNNQLSRRQTNDLAELSIPREIISFNASSGSLRDYMSFIISSSTLQSELLRPIIAGTYGDAPAFLVRIQLQLGIPGDNHSWLSRIKTASINVHLQDAPSEKTSYSRRDGRPHPSVVKVFPGPNGWEGKQSTSEVTETSDAELQLGWDPVAISAKMGESRTKIETGAVCINTVRKGRDRNSLIVAVAENPVDVKGIPEFLVIPLIIIHHDRRFSMRVSVNASFGFWRGMLAKMVPVLGLADEPLYFDPFALRLIMEGGQKGIDGVNVVEWRGELDNIDLSEHFSLIGKAVPSSAEGHGVNTTPHNTE